MRIYRWVIPDYYCDEPVSNWTSSLDTLAKWKEEFIASKHHCAEKIVIAESELE